MGRRRRRRSLSSTQERCAQAWPSCRACLFSTCWACPHCWATPPSSQQTGTRPPTLDPCSSGGHLEGARLYSTSLTPPLLEPPPLKSADWCYVPPAAAEVIWKGTPADSPVKDQAACGSCWVSEASTYPRPAGHEPDVYACPLHPVPAPSTCPLTHDRHPSPLPLQLSRGRPSESATPPFPSAPALCLANWSPSAPWVPSTLTPYPLNPEPSAVLQLRGCPRGCLLQSHRHPAAAE